MADLKVMSVKISAAFIEKFKALTKNYPSQRETMEAAISSLEGNLPDNTAELTNLKEENQRMKTLLDQYGCTPEVLRSTILERNALERQVNELKSKQNTGETLPFTPEQIQFITAIALPFTPVEFLMNLLEGISSNPGEKTYSVKVSQADYQAYIQFKSQKS